MLIELAQNLGNRVLDFDPGMRDRLQQLDGRVLAVELTGIDKTLFAIVEGQSLALRDTHDGAPDITLRGSPLAFVGYVLDREASTPSAITIEGDAALAQRFLALLKAVDIDWEELMAHYVGDVLARQMSRATHTMGLWLRDAAEGVRSDISEYLQEESRLLAPAVRVTRFMSQVDELRSDVERLEQRVNRLAKAGV